jgi:hypothetical protein
MSDRELEVAIARRILGSPRDFGWIIPLVREFLRLREREARKDGAR